MRADSTLRDQTLQQDLSNLVEAGIIFRNRATNNHV